MKQLEQDGDEDDADLADQVILLTGVILSHTTHTLAVYYRANCIVHSGCDEGQGVGRLDGQQPPRLGQQGRQALLNF